MLICHHITESHSLFNQSISTFHVKLVWLCLTWLPMTHLGFLDPFRQSGKVRAVLCTVLLTPTGRRRVLRLNCAEESLITLVP